MAWTYKFIGVDNNGKILSDDAASGIIGDFSLEQTIGDEFVVQSGDVSIKHTNDLPFTSLGGPSKYFLGFYWNDVLYDAFRIKRGFDKKSLKYSTKYESRLQSIQKSFFEDAAAIVIADGSGDSTSWNYNVQNAVKTITELGYIDAGGTAQFFTDGRYAFALPPLLRTLGDHDAHSDKGYRLKALTCPGPEFNENDMPFLYRGASSTVLATAISATFYDKNITWFDMLKLACIIFNAFIFAKPVIYSIGGDDHLGIEIFILPRTVFSGTPATAIWLDSNFNLERLNVLGVRLSSSIQGTSVYRPNLPIFEWTYGDVSSKNIHEKTVDLGDAAVPFSDPENTLFLVAGDYISSEYDILSAPDTPELYFQDTYILSYYEDLIDVSCAVDGKIRFSGERCGDIVTVPGSIAGITIQVNKLNPQKSGKASISGITV